MIRYNQSYKVANRTCPLCHGTNIDISERVTEISATKTSRQVSYKRPEISCRDCEMTYEASEARQAEHDATCISMNLVTPIEMKQIRKDNGMSAETFARFLGFGLSSIKRWEARYTFPNRSCSNLIKLIFMEGLEVIENIDKRFDDLVFNNHQPTNLITDNPDNLLSKLSESQKLKRNKKKQKFFQKIRMNQK